MKLNRLSLIESLKKVFPVLVSNPFVPEYECFQFCKKLIWATDGEVAVTTFFDAGLSIDCAVSGFSFLYLLETLKEDQIELVQDKENLKVITLDGKIKATFSTHDAKEPPSLPDVDASWTESSSGVETSMKRICLCRFGVSEDRTAGTLCGVRVQDGEALACNRYRVVRSRLLDEFKNINCTLSVKFLDLLSKSKEKVDRFSVVKDETFWVVFKDGTTVMAPFLMGKYREVGQYFPNSDSFLEIDLGSEFEDILVRHIGFLKKVSSFDKMIEITFRKNVCTLFSYDVELGNLHEDISLDLPVDRTVKFAMNPVLLQDVIKTSSKFKYFVDEELILFETEDLGCVIKVTPVSDEK